eukprot:CAMPEP_0194147620 /NCGR_PEP_ID=MMETSP0152-20130528/26376_1 /TAXON_ID=1049557 /ORGANISM="Thalassiothrix antarctica, Strain L6-D1" /LENGTH=338 /DNA_ID=CAMNT_0038848563 /DNA_START=45 /DNA_END=1062 /DNA_ORIENTATION=-
MAPPPTQAGKFKPRKPVKRVSASATSATASSSVRSSSSSGRSIGHPVRPGRGRGRGRGRVPLPRGQVFFTGNSQAASAKISSVGSKGGGLTASGLGGESSAKKPSKRVTIKMEGKHEKGDEAIVGELDEAIGASMGAEKVRILERTPRDGISQFQDDAAAINPAFSVAETYDSDSSNDTTHSKRRPRGRNGLTNRFLQPSQLPFPNPVEPMGVGSTADEILSAQYEDDNEADSPQLYSPFAAGAKSIDQDSKGQDSWYLFQFPTRLPVKEIQAPDTVSSEEVVANEEIPAAMSIASEVSTPHLLVDSFDNTLTKCSGYMGKLLVYKSGKTVLAMGRPD